MEKMCEMQNDINELKDNQRPVSKFFNNLEKPEPKKKTLTKAELEAEEDEKDNALLKARALKLMKKEKGLV
ncbi:MAG: hypothetical protein EOO96_06345 [Pedobacter sp.]|nr:MAG: hypothetical protein EOO96_06345 [Pedobacter sp.]